MMEKYEVGGGPVSGLTAVHPRPRSPPVTQHQWTPAQPVTAIQLCNTCTCDMARDMLCVTYHTICLTVSSAIMSQLTAAAL